MGDSVFGFWLASIARRERLNLTLVNSMLGVQHHPWATYTRGAFSNRSVVLHGLKGAKSPFWQFAAQRGAGPFQPTTRRCGACGGGGGCAGCAGGGAGMRWSSWPGDPAAGWTCCGEALPGSGGETLTAPVTVFTYSHSSAAPLRRSQPGGCSPSRRPRAAAAGGRLGAAGGSRAPPPGGCTTQLCHLANGCSQRSVGSGGDQNRWGSGSGSGS